MCLDGAVVASRSFGFANSATEFDERLIEIPWSMAGRGGHDKRSGTGPGRRFSGAELTPYE